MACLKKVLCVALAVVVAVASAENHFSVVQSPDYVQLDQSAGAIRAVDVPSALANILGFESAETRMGWSGVVSTNVFKRPSATVSVMFDGFAGSLSLGAKATTFPLLASSAADALSGKNGASLSSIVSEMAGASSFTLSVSASEELATAASPRDSFANNDHVVFTNAAGNFQDSSMSIVVTKAEVVKSFSASLLGSGVVYNANSNTFTVGTQSFSMSDVAVNAVFTELHASLLVLTKALQMPHARPSVFALTISAVRNVPSTPQMAQVLSAYAAKAVAMVSEAFGADAVVGTVITTSPETAAPLHVTARAAATAAAALSDPTPYVPDQSMGANDFIANCATYTCYCNAFLLNGVPTDFNFDTGCEDHCDLKTNYCNCAYRACDCTSPFVQVGSARCNACLPGFSLQGGQCYVSSNYPGMIQIWLWGGLLITAGLLATCYSIGGMDPGRNGIIYRMTQQRVKAN